MTITVGVVSGSVVGNSLANTFSLGCTCLLFVGVYAVTLDHFCLVTMTGV